MKPLSIRKEDFFSSFSLFLVSLPINLGIAIASNASPAAGVMSAIFAALFFGVFSSSSIAMYGPAAGLCVFISAHAIERGSLDQVSEATILAGIFLIVLSRLRAHKVVHLIPMSVIKGMAAGIGLTLVLKMLPHLVGFEDELLEAEGFLGIESFRALQPGEENESRFSWTATVISIICTATAWRFRNHTRWPFAFLVVVVGGLLAWGARVFFPDHALSHAQMLHLNLSHFVFESPDWKQFQILPVLKLAVIITLVILLEGAANLNIIQRIDPKRRPVQMGRELKLMGIANIILGWISALPVMPILVRSTANVTFGAQTRASGILQGLWLMLAVLLHQLFQFIPMAAVASLLTLVGLSLVNVRETQAMLKQGKQQWLPFVITVAVILSVDLLSGIVVGLVIGAYFSIRSSIYRSMVLVEDKGNYLLKFFKDVSFVHKAELMDHLEQVPPNTTLYIDGAGNVQVDLDIEDVLLDYQKESQMHGRTVTFLKSHLAISKLFKFQEDSQ